MISVSFFVPEYNKNIQNEKTVNLNRNVLVNYHEYRKNNGFQGQINILKQTYIIWIDSGTILLSATVAQGVIHSPRNTEEVGSNPDPGRYIVARMTT